MTREEAREAIKEAYGNSEYTDEIINALEQEQDKPMVEIDLYSVIKQKYIEREVLDKIRSEIKNLERFEIRGEVTPLVNVDRVLKIIDKIESEKV